MIDEIVAAYINEVVTNDREEIIKNIEAGGNPGFISRRVANLMMIADLNPKWIKLVQSPTLFRIEDGKPLPPNEEVTNANP